jgi:hypothetical protein
MSSPGNRFGLQKVSPRFAVDLALIDLYRLVVQPLSEMQPRFRIHVGGKFIFARRDNVAGIVHDLALVVERNLLPMLGRSKNLQLLVGTAGLLE